MAVVTFKLSAIALAAGLAAVRGAQVATSDLEGARANPIRKVVTMLETMQKKVQAEGAVEEANYRKFMCYCQTNRGALTDAITDAEAKVPRVSSDIDEAESAKTQLDAELKGHATDRDAAKASVVEATGIREKAAVAFAKSRSELSGNIRAIQNAVAALEKGMAGGFLQTSARRVLQKLIESQENIIDVDRQTVMNFLSNGEGSGYSPKSGEITGILKSIGDDMSKRLADETTAEESSIQDHKALVAAKSKEIAAHSAAIEEKSVRVGEVAVSIAQMKNDLSDSQRSLVDDKNFLQELGQGCDTKATEWAERQKTRSEELVALAETIKLLSDDDALELFKKSAGDSFVQLNAGASNLQTRALAILLAARGKSPVAQRPGFDFIALALEGKTGGFEKVMKMIDNMVEVLKNEQQDDDHKREYCGTQLDLADDKKKGLEASVSDEDASVTNAQEGVAALAQELKNLAAGIDNLDKSVADATEQRKVDHVAFQELMALDSQAKDLLDLAKNRLNQFYNPRMYMAPPKKELAGSSFVQVVAHHGAAPLPPPDTFEGAYAKKGQASTGVIAMIDMLIKDLDKEMTEAETNEKDAQRDYEAMLADAKDKRATDSKSVTDKGAAKASLEMELLSHKDAKTSATRELSATTEYIQGLHLECDWLVEHYEVRKEARSSEAESLANAKAVLAGSDYAFVQVHDSSRGASL
jgi:hypothetical protein